MRIKLVSDILDRKWVEIVIISSMILVVSLVFSTPDLVWIQKFSAYAFEAVILFLVSAMGFMILDKPRIMFACLAMAMALSLYLKDKSRGGLESILPNVSTSFSIAQLLISDGADQYAHISKHIEEINSDIIQIQEISPDWIHVIDAALKVKYPYKAQLIRIDPYGMALYSKYPIKKIDTLEFNDSISSLRIPALKLVLNVHNKELVMIACHLLPRLNTADFSKVQQFMISLSDWVKNNASANLIISGDLGITPWDHILQKFVTESSLELSRREPHLFVQPFEHIFYADGIECNKLKEVVTSDRIHLGIEGAFHFLAN